MASFRSHKTSLAELVEHTFSVTATQFVANFSFRRKKKPKSDAPADPLDPLSALQEDLTAEVTEKDSDIKDLLRVYDSMSARKKTHVEGDRGGLTGRFQRVCREISGHNSFDHLVCLLIISNLIVVAIETDHYEENQAAMDWLSAFFSILFLSEIVVRSVAQSHCEFLLVFDALVVTAFFADLLLRLQKDTDVRRAIHLPSVRLLRCFRVVRILRAVKVGRHFKSVRVLVDGIRRAMQPLFVVMTITMVLVLAFGVMMTSLVPAAVTEEEDDPASAVAMELYSSLSRSVRSMLKALGTTPDWALPAFDLLTNGSVGCVLMLWGLVLTAAVLILALGGLVTGVYLEQLINISGSEEEEEAQEELHQSHECMRALDKIFTAMGYGGDESMSWTEIQRALQASKGVQERLGIDLEDAKKLFAHLDDDGDGLVSSDEFVFSVFKLRTISKSIEMLAIDYQQEKALQGIADLHMTLKLHVAHVQRRLFLLAHFLHDLREELGTVHRDMDEMQDLELSLVSKLEAREAARLRTAEECLSDMAHVSVEDMSRHFRLNERLQSLEAEFARLEETAQGSPPVDANTIAAVADGIVRSIQTTIERDWAYAKASGRSSLAPPAALA